MTQIADILEETGPELISVSEALRRNYGKVRVSGMITSTSKLYKMISKIKLYCNQCNKLTEFEYQRPTTEIKSDDRICFGCTSTGKKMYATLSDTDYISVLNVELQDTESFNDIDRLPVMLFDKDTIDIKVGERVTITGEIVVIHKDGRDISRTKMFPFLFSESIKYENKAIIELTDLDKEAIKRYCNRGSVIDNLVKLVDPSIIDYEHVKKGLLLIAVNTGYEYNNYLNLNFRPDKDRHRLNAVLIGDPGLAKSRLLKSAVKIVPNSRYESGENSSVLSLTAIVSKEEENYVLRLGPASLAKGAICAINEFGKMNPDDQSHLHSIMEEGEYTVNKYGINANIISPTTIIASANPIGSEWMDKDKIDNGDFPALSPIIDRFDLKFVFRRYTEIDQIRKYALRKAEIADKKQPDYTPFLIKYIEYAKQLNPIITDEARLMFVEFFSNLSFKGFGTNRVLETLFRISRAIARLKLKEIVDPEDAKETIEFYNVMLQNYGQTTTVPTEPRDLTIMQCIKILQEKQSGITLEELIKDVCSNDENGYISRYLGFGHRSLKMMENKKVRNVYEILIKNPHVKRTHEKPVVLQWFDSDPDPNSDSVYDPYDLYDQAKTKSENENDNHDISNTTEEKAGSYESYRSYRDCYYCTENFDFDSDYKKHVLNKHLGKLCYPNKAYIEKHGLESQGRDWET
jgi:replicative DNA helicase Mcm